MKQGRAEDLPALAEQVAAHRGIRPRQLIGSGRPVAASAARRELIRGWQASSTLLVLSNRQETVLFEVHEKALVLNR